MKKVLSALSVLLIICILSIPVAAVENLAFQIVEATASTYYNEDYHPSSVYDGIIWKEDMRLPSWISDFDTEADLTLTWDSAVTIAKAVLYDLPNADDNVIKGTMTFSDGTKVDFGALNPDGTATEIALPKSITATSVVIHVVASDTAMSVGLNEVELYDASGVNVARNAKAIASSVQPDGDPYWYIPAAYTEWYGAHKAINGVVAVNRPTKAENEYASKGEPLPWIKLQWAAPIKIGTIVIYDRVGDADWITEGDITFSDGTVVSFAGLDNNGAPLYVDIPDVTADSFTIQVTVSDGPNPGFAEIEVYTEHFNADGTPVITEAQTAAPADPAAVNQAPAAAPVVKAPQTADTGMIFILLLSASAVYLVISRKLRYSK